DEAYHQENHTSKPRPEYVMRKQGHLFPRRHTSAHGGRAPEWSDRSCWGVVSAIATRRRILRLKLYTLERGDFTVFGDSFHFEIPSLGRLVPPPSSCGNNASRCIRFCGACAAVHCPRPAGAAVIRADGAGGRASQESASGRGGQRDVHAGYAQCGKGRAA